MKNNYKRYFFFLLMFLSSSCFGIDPVIILIGPPGSGKGTFSQYFKENYGYNHLSIGDILRNEVSMQTELGYQIAEIIKRGDYIDPGIVHTLLRKYVIDYQAKGKPFILDGFGRNQNDFQVMRKLFQETGLLSKVVVVYLQAINSICQERILNRLVCASCGRVYNKISAIPKHPDTCDQCGAELQSRFNDTPEVVRKRLEHHRHCIEKYYKEALSLFPAIIYDANGPLEDCILFYEDFAQFSLHNPGTRYYPPKKKRNLAQKNPKIDRSLN